MPIPLSTVNVNNAINYNAPLTATPMNVCAHPQEGARCIPMQFIFPNNFSGGIAASLPFYVDMSAGAPTPPISQVATLYVDCASMNTDIVIIFPDTGYTITVPAGSTRCVPAFTGKQLPKFYVSFPSQNSVIVGGTVNILAINQFIPSFETGDVYVHALGVANAIESASAVDNIESIFYTPDFESPINQTYNFINGQAAYLGDTIPINDYTVGFAGVLGPFAKTVILPGDTEASFWNLNIALDSLDISLAASTTDSSTVMCQMALITSNGANVFSKMFEIGPSLSAQTIVSLTNLKNVVQCFATVDTPDPQIQIGITDINGDFTLTNLTGQIVVNIGAAIISVF